MKKMCLHKFISDYRYLKNVCPQEFDNATETLIPRAALRPE